MIWLTDVDLGDGNPGAQIVFGGDHLIEDGDLVPVAPPGARVVLSCERYGVRVRRMRARTYRGQRSHGMLCSLGELGWLAGGPNEVALLRNVTVGQSLDHLGPADWPDVVVGWRRAEVFARGVTPAMAQPVLA